MGFFAFLARASPLSSIHNSSLILSVRVAIVLAQREDEGEKLVQEGRFRPTGELFEAGGSIEPMLRAGGDLVKAPPFSFIVSTRRKL